MIIHGTQLPVARRLNHKGSVPGNLELLKVSVNSPVRSNNSSLVSDLPPLKIPASTSIM